MIRERKYICNGKPGQKHLGYALVTVVLAMAVLLGLLGLAIDFGYLEYVKRRMQAAADAAAMAAAQELLRNASDSTIQSSAKNDSRQNGFTDGSKGVEVKVNHPPTSGFYSGDANAVEVIITQTQPTFFMRVFHFASVLVGARAVGHLFSSPGCIYISSPTAKEALLVSDGSQVQTNGCGIAVESNNSSHALEVTRGSTLIAASIGVVGKYESEGANNTLSPTPTTGIPTSPDPLAYLQPPTPGSCTSQQASNFPVGTTTLNPGTFCGGINVSGNGVNVTFSPGTYVVDRGLTVQSGASVQGTGVTFFLTGGANYQGLTISGAQTSATLSGPSDGSLTDILFYQDPNIPPSAISQKSSIQGGSTTSLQGALYFPTTELDFSGGSSTSAPFTIIDVYLFKITQGSKVTLNTNYGRHGSPAKAAVLGE